MLKIIRIYREEEDGMKTSYEVMDVKDSGSWYKFTLTEEEAKQLKVALIQRQDI